MIKRILLQTFLFVFLSLPLGVLADEDFSGIFIFGDSLSDNGNLAAVPGFEFLSSPFLPFDSGFSNGPRAVEVLADELGLSANPSLHLTSPFPLGTNFAVAGARAVTLGPPPTIDLPTQIGAFLVSHGGIAPQDALYVVFIGGNDIRDARDAPDKKQAKAFIRDAVDGVRDAIAALAGAGAEHILVANAPDIGAIPETRLLALFLGDRKFVKRATKLTKSFNKKLKKALRKLEHKLDIDIQRFDTFKFFRFVRKHAGKLGFTNSQDACFRTAVFFETGVPTFHPDCNFDEFVFFDEIHPTAKVHLLTGSEMAEVVQEDDD